MIERPLMLPAEDAWEGDYLGHNPDAIRVSVRAWIHYRDKDGQESQRNVVTQLLAPTEEDDYAFNAYCEGREARRTFVVSRVLQFVDRETGEVVDDVLDYLQEAYANSPVGILERTVEDNWAELTALVFVARADGNMRSAQRAPILRFIRDQARGVAWSDEELTSRIAGIKPAAKQFRDALKNVAASPGSGSSLLPLLEEIAASRGESGPLAEAAVETARKILMGQPVGRASRRAGLG